MDTKCKAIEPQIILNLARIMILQGYKKDIPYNHGIAIGNLAAFAAFGILTDEEANQERELINETVKQAVSQ